MQLVPKVKPGLEIELVLPSPTDTAAPPLLGDYRIAAETFVRSDLSELGGLELVASGPGRVPVKSGATLDTGIALAPRLWGESGERRASRGGCDG